MSIQPNPALTMPAHRAPWPMPTYQPPCHFQAAPVAPGQGRPVAAGVSTSEEATAVMPRRFPGAPAAQPPTAAVPPPGWAHWSGSAYPPGSAYRPGPVLETGRRKGVWIGGAIAVVVVVVVGAGALIAVAGRSQSTPAPSSASAPAASASTSPAPSEATPVPNVGIEALAGLMLDAGIVNGIEGATDIRLVHDPNSGAPFSEMPTDKPECAGIAHPAQIDTLRGSGYLGAHTEKLDGDIHFVAEAVIDYPSAAAASKFAAQQAENWSKCDGKPLTLISPSEGSTTVAVGPVTNTNGMLSVVFTEEGGRGWGCQRALTTRNNIVIDTRSCGYNRSDQAIQEATRIADRVNTG
jgi:hypothetical protein